MLKYFTLVLAAEYAAWRKMCTVRENMAPGGFQTSWNQKMPARARNSTCAPQQDLVHHLDLHGAVQLLYFQLSSTVQHDPAEPFFGQPRRKLQQNAAAVSFLKWLSDHAHGVTRKLCNVVS